MKTKVSRRKVGLLVAALLLTLAPATALAAEQVPFTATGPIEGIDQGQPSPIGKSGRFVVIDRTVTGTFSGGISGAFTFTFRANVDLETQSGPIHGTLSVDSGEEARVQGFSRLVLGPALALDPVLAPAVVLILHVRGTLVFTAGAQGNASIDATVTAAVDPFDGHIVGVIASGAPVVDLTTFLPVGVTSSQATLTGRLHQ